MNFRSKAYGKMSLTAFLLFLLVTTSLASDPYVIKFHSPNLYPEGMTWDSSNQHFIVGSLRYRALFSVSDAAVAVDTPLCPLLAVIHFVEDLTPFNALAANDLRSLSPIFLYQLPSDLSTTSHLRDVANDVAVEFLGNAYITNSGNNFIWKVNIINGEASIFSESPFFTKYRVDPSTPNSSSGLNGIAYIGKGYLLFVQSNTGKMFKVDAVDGIARTVILNGDLLLADDVAVKKNGVVVVVSPINGAWFLKSQDTWSEGWVIDRDSLISMASRHRWQ
ncbi:hypothetical protein Ancab_016391 [Ancistrocladus abbreviatus]